LTVPSTGIRGSAASETLSTAPVARCAGDALPSDEDDSFERAFELGADEIALPEALRDPVPRGS
jgi:hypothetical protein